MNPMLCKTLLPLSLFVASLPLQLNAQLYWDTNGDTAGAGVTADGTWDLETTANWSSSADGDVATVIYTAGQSVIFSAGSDTTSAAINVAASFSASPFTMTVNAGSYTFTGTQLSGLISMDIKSGAVVDMASIRLNGTGNPIIQVDGDITASSIISNGTLTINGTGSMTSNGLLDANVNLNGASLTITGGNKTKHVTVSDGGSFIIAASNTVIDNFNVTLSNGSLRLSSGVTDTINNLTGTGSVIGETGTTLTVGKDSKTGNDFAGLISGELNLIKIGTTAFTLNSGANFTSTGNITVNTGTFTMADGSAITFTIGADGVNNAILGAGTDTATNLNGTFNFDLSGAEAVGGNSWLIVDVNNLAESFGSTFAVADFTETAVDSGIWTFGDYTFTESTGTLTYGALIPEPSTFALLGGLGALFAATTHRRGRTAQA